MVPSPLSELLECAHVVSLALTTPFRGLTQREAIIFDSPRGPSEWSPFVEYDDAEAALWLASAIEDGWHDSTLPEPPASIRVNGTIPAVSPQEATTLITEAGFPHTVKVKVGGPTSSLDEDHARVQAVRAALGPTGRIRLDANGAWALDEAEHAIRLMEHCDIDYVEQPVESLADMAVLRTRMAEIGIGLAADESIRRWADLDAVIAQGAADIVVIKVQPLGGLRRAHDTIKKAHAAGLQVVISSALETSVGIYHAATLQGFLESQNPHALDAGLGTVSFLGDDVVESPLRAHGGKLSVTKPRLDQGALTRVRAPKDREQWWRARLERCFALL